MRMIEWPMKVMHFSFFLVYPNSARLPTSVSCDAAYVAQGLIE